MRASEHDRRPGYCTLCISLLKSELSNLSVVDRWLNDLCVQAARGTVVRDHNVQYIELFSLFTFGLTTLSYLQARYNFI